MQIQVSWLLQKPTDLDLHCLQSQGMSGFSRTRVKYAHKWHFAGVLCMHVCLIQENIYVSKCWCSAHTINKVTYLFKKNIRIGFENMSSNMWTRSNLENMLEVNIFKYGIPVLSLVRNCLKHICLTLVLLIPDIPCLCKQYRSRSAGFWRTGSALFVTKYVNLYHKVISLAGN